MKGPPPKPSGLRQRRNRHSTAATLPAAEVAADFDVPEMPVRRVATEDGEVVAPWHPLVVEWWGEVWRSPMATEYLGADVRGGLRVLLDLYQAFHTATSITLQLKLAAELRRQEERYGLDSMARRRLQWTIEQGESAEERTRRRRERSQPAVPDGAEDPRGALRVVS